MKIKLNEYEVNIANAIGTARTSFSDARGHCQKNTNHTPAKFVEYDKQGARGEIAFCKMHNIFPDLTPGPDKWDCILPTGEKVDVKTTSMVDSDLMACRKSYQEVDLIAMVEEVGNEYTLVGTIDAETMTQDKYLEPRGSDLIYMVPREELEI